MGDRGREFSAYNNTQNEFAMASGLGREFSAQNTTRNELDIVNALGREFSAYYSVQETSLTWWALWSESFLFTITDKTN